MPTPRLTRILCTGTFPVNILREQESFPRGVPGRRNYVRVFDFPRASTAPPSVHSASLPSPHFLQVLIPLALSELEGNALTEGSDLVGRDLLLSVRSRYSSTKSVPSKAMLLRPQLSFFRESLLRRHQSLSSLESALTRKTPGGGGLTVNETPDNRRFQPSRKGCQSRATNGSEGPRLCVSYKGPLFRPIIGSQGSRLSSLSLLRYIATSLLLSSRFSITIPALHSGAQFTMGDR